MKFNFSIENDSERKFIIINFAILLVIVVLYLLYKYLVKHFDYWSKQGIPGDKPRLFIGTLKPFWKKGLREQDKESLKKFGRVFGTFEGRNPILVVADIDLVKIITVKEFSIFRNRRPLSIGGKNVKKMLSSQKDKEWKEMRSVLSPTFTSGKLKEMTGLMKDCIQSSMKSLQKYDGQTLDMKDWFFSVSLQVMAICMFGMKINLDNPNNEFTVNTKKALYPTKMLLYFQQIWPSLMITYAHYFKDPLKYFYDLARQTIYNRKKSNQMAVKRDYLQILMDARKENPNGKKVLKTDDIISQIALFLVSGHEPIANSLAVMAFALATNEDVQEKLLKEIDDVTIKDNGKLTYESIMDMKYLDMVLCEVLRLYGPAIRFDRECDQDDFDLGGIKLQKGNVVVVSVYGIHNDPQYYPEPEKFDPERFSPEEKAKRNSFTFLPFGIGLRNCIAMRFALVEIKVIMAHMLSHFRFVKCGKTQIPLEFTDGIFALSKPKSIYLIAEKRLTNPTKIKQNDLF